METPSEKDEYNPAHDTASKDADHEGGIDTAKRDALWLWDKNMDNTLLATLQVRDPDANTLTGLKADDHDKGYISDWKYKPDEVNDGGADVDEYVITAKDSDGNVVAGTPITVAHKDSADGTQSYTIENLGGPASNRVLGVYEFTVTAHNRLLIPNENRYASGSYSHNEAGITSDKVYAKVADLPDRTGNPVATSNATAGTVTLTWTVPANSRVLGTDVSKHKISQHSTIRMLMRTCGRRVHLSRLILSLK